MHFQVYYDVFQIVELHLPLICGVEPVQQRTEAAICALADATASSNVAVRYRTTYGLTSNVTEQSKIRESAETDVDLGILIEQLHTIKRKFVTEYYGQIPLGTYEMARNCIIKLNTILFEVSSMTAEPSFFGIWPTSIQQG